MFNDNLKGKLVPHHFWPACFNCTHYQECKAGVSKNEAFPRNWHWAREFVSFPDGDLILSSWVGIFTIKGRRNGCYDYQVDLQGTLPLQDHHRQYLELEQERCQLNAEMNKHEKRSTYDKNAEALYQRDNDILKAQRKLIGFN